MNRLHVRLGIFGAVPIGILQDRRVKLHGLKSYIAISSYQGTHESCAPSQEQIAERAGIDVRHARSGIRQLVQCGWLAKRRRGLGMTDVYHTLAYLDEAPRGKTGPGAPDPDRTESVRSEEVQTGQNLSALDRTESVRPDRTESVLSSSLKDQLKDQEEDHIAGSPPAAEEPPPSDPSNGAGNGDNGKPRRKGKHSPEDVALFQEVADLIRYGTTDRAEALRRKEREEFRGPAWAGVKDSEAVYRGIRFARSQHPAQAREYLIELVEGAWELHEGRVPGMSDFDKRRWADVPFTPCKLDWQQIDATLTRLAPAKDDVPSFEEMERMGIGKPGGPKPWEWFRE